MRRRRRRRDRGPMTKVDPGLLHVVARHLRLSAGRSESAASPGAERPSPVVHVAVRYTGDLDDLRAAGFEPLSRIRTSPDGWSIVAGRLPLDRVGALDAVDHVVEIEGARPVVPQLDQSVHAI